MTADTQIVRQMPYDDGKRQALYNYQNGQAFGHAYNT